MTLFLRSSAFDDGAIPLRYSCDGEDISPALSWGAAPPGTESLVLIMDDPDAPGGTWDHWVVYNIPKESTGLEEAQPKLVELPTGGVHGENSWGNLEYGGPCPPNGPAHTYRFFLYAVDTFFYYPGIPKELALEGIQGHILAEGLLIGTYERGGGGTVTD